MSKYGKNKSRRREGKHPIVVFTVMRRGMYNKRCGIPIMLLAIADQSFQELHKNAKIAVRTRYKERKENAFRLVCDDWKIRRQERIPPKDIKREKQSQLTLIRQNIFLTCHEPLLGKGGITIKIPWTDLDSLLENIGKQELKGEP